MKLVVPIDRSHRDAAIIPYAAGIALPLRACLSVVHIVPGPRSLFPGAMREAEAYADLVVQELKESGAEAESFVGHGDPAELILQLVRDLSADMVVMATRGRRGMGKIVLGSVADTILHLCPVPLLLVNADNALAARPPDVSDGESSQAA